ncbi:MAG: CDP-glucose 4,6-dehydratase [Bacteroidia bacterium]|nr:CDP-glucose 4,6-dehydratase [Bacteroidia bacterium]NND25711.1 CDP-glucose 4,6-dehydratase [Flavobacteriaceae bacterium]MBT8279223.1 CDP-glucose 4,6-dehydratase [Bacteroidia bacterium]NNK59759.1 CDP-glucose 4,6-dehydratase [Flavobacteriaceae bacterium]NNL32023.1 CDP-glucose 4,6-dehydratase [Flavobacteriaceae bacterium]
MGRLNGNVNPSFWNNKRVFLTGHTGFKGGWLSIWLHSMGAIVKGYALEPPTDPSLFIEANVNETLDSFIGDIRDLPTLSQQMADFNPEILIHMAAQPLVRLSYDEPLETYTTNVIGTANVLEAARSCNQLKAIVSVTTDKCYENMEWERGYREDEPMGGHDPYSSSKGCAELVTSAYRRSYFNTSETASVATARAGNVIGGGDWAADRLIPDILKAFEKNKPVIIRNPLSTRPWQHVLEPLSGYLVLAQNLYENGDDFAEAWNFGPKDDASKPVKWILDKMVSKWGNNANWELDKNSNPHEAGFLKLDCSKAASKLDWRPKWDLEHALDLIINWHRKWLQGGSVKDQCLNEIESYQVESKVL